MFLLFAAFTCSCLREREHREHVNIAPHILPPGKGGGTFLKGVGVA